MAACAEDKTSSPPEIPIAIDFQSPAVAVATENVKVYVYKDLQQKCGDLITLRQTGQPLPASTTESAPITPCDMLHGANNNLTLDLKSNYTVFAVGQIAGKDVLIGCAVQPAYGSAQSIPVALTLIDEQVSIGTTQCTKLSDKCNGACQ